jgi:hypothetical protein
MLFSYIFVTSRSLSGRYVGKRGVDVRWNLRRSGMSDLNGLGSQSLLGLIAAGIMGPGLRKSWILNGKNVRN